MARLDINPWLGLGETMHGGVERELGAMPQRAASGDDLNATLVADGRVEVHVSQARVLCDPRASFAAHLGDCMLEWEGSCC